MQASIEMYVGQGKLRALIAAFTSGNQNWNEAQNRFQFIDELLVQCLGWQKPDMCVEVTDDAGGRADYIFGNPAKAVLEAKKPCVHYDSIATGNASKVQKLRNLMKASKSFDEAVNQVVPYCIQNGASIAVVCNGPQLAVFQAFIPGVALADGDCYFFNGYQDYVANFPLLWNLLSPEGITENRAYSLLSSNRIPRIPSKCSQSITEPNKHRYRDSLQEELRSLSTILFEEVEDNPDFQEEFYENCYVPIEANNRHLLLSKQAIRARYKRVPDNGIEPQSVSVENFDQLGLSQSSRPIVLLGDVGVGKSSFFEKLFLTFGRDSRADTFVVRINLGTKANLTSDLKTYILDAIKQILLATYDTDIESNDFVSAVYARKLSEFDRSVDGQLKSINFESYQLAKLSFLKSLIEKRDRHLQASLEHIYYGRKRSVIIAIDNADQRTFSIQQEAFLIAQEIAAFRICTVFIALRPSTFYVSKNSGSLSGYQNKVLTISPPPADEVVMKRLSFALRIAEGRNPPANLQRIRISLPNIVLFLKATLRSVKSNEAIKQFLSNVTGGNTRAVIELIGSFCGSPNVDARKIVDIEERTGQYNVPLHEFSKHALLGEYAYFNSQSSFVAFNVFDICQPDVREHFLSCLIVGYLISNLGIRDNDGFVSSEQIVAEMATLSFSAQQTHDKLALLAEKRMIETPYSHHREIPVGPRDGPIAHHYRATTIGAYHIRFWIGNFSFLDAVSTDTPVFDEVVRVAISRDASSFDISARFRKTKQFKTYLETQWHNANFLCSYFDFMAVLKEQEPSFVAVEKAIDKLSRKKV